MSTLRIESKDPSDWKFYAEFYRGSFRPLIMSVALSVLQSMTVVPIAWLVRFTFDKVIPSSNTHLLIVVGVAIILLNTVSNGLNLVTRFLSLRTTKLAIRKLREELLSRCYLLSRSFHSKSDHSKLHTTIVQDSERLDVMSNALVASFIPALVISIALCIVLITLSTKLFAVMIVLSPLLFVVDRLMGRRVRLWVNAFYRSFEAFNKGVLFVLQMMDLTRFQSAEQLELQRQKKALEDLRVTSEKMAWLQGAYGLVQNTIVTVSTITILVVGGMAVASSSMTLGTMLSFYVVVTLLSNYLQQLFASIPQIVAGRESLRALHELSETKEPLPYSGKKKLDFKGNIGLASVWFGYSDKPVLQEVTLNIPSGMITAVVGPNGVGKTTIAQLILGLYRPQRGELLGDNHPYDDLDITHLRGYFGVAPQNPIIFPGTILENITYGSPHIQPDEISRVCEIAMVDAFVGEFLRGYETMTGEDGVLVSGGQCQRIAIARALLRRPRLLILDEPTNHLDEDSVCRILRNLKELDYKPAILLITQNMSIAKEAQHIYALDRGKLSSI